MTPQTLIHPVFCGGPEAGCTVVPGVDWPATGAAHRSRPVTLDLSSSIDALMVGATVATAHLFQMAAPWPTATFLSVRVAGTEFTIPVDAARDLLAAVAGLLDRAAPTPHPDDLTAAELATRNGSPASADDDTCPRCGVAWGTTWSGEDDFGQSHWVHDFAHPDALAAGDPLPCGTRWTTKVRRPGNGVALVLVFPSDTASWETRCYFCGGRSTGHPTEHAAQVWADQHTTDHETEERK